MKVYVSSRFNRKEEVRSLFRALAAKGHTITRDWTQDPVIKPYDADPDSSKSHAIESAKAITGADCHILLTDETATGSYVEFGIAVASNIATGKPRIIVVGSHNARTMFFFHPSVERVETPEEALAKL